jgi:hypothetical protein
MMTVLWVAALGALAALAVAVAVQWAAGISAEAQWRREERLRPDITDALATTQPQEIRYARLAPPTGWRPRGRRR